MSVIESEDLPLVSVIVSTYRRSSTLKKALFSIGEQTYSKIEIIVVDDNADFEWNNEVKKIIEDVKSQIEIEVLYIVNMENKGSAETRNIGIKKSNGYYITFLDDDDIYLQNKVKNQVEHMMNCNSDYSLTDLYLYDEKNRLIEKRKHKYIKELSKKNLLKYHMMYHMTGTDVMMFKKEYLLKIGGFSPINVGDEFYLMQKAIEWDGEFSYLPVCDVKAYVHVKTNGLSSGAGKINGENALYEHKKRFFTSLNLNRKEIKYIKMRHYAVLAFTELRRKKKGSFLKNSFLSFLSSPLGCVALLLKTRK